MKSFLLCTLLGSSLLTPTIDQLKLIDHQELTADSKVKTPRKIQLVILFDTSNSMDGLLDQAKSRLWEIVNESGSLRYNGQIPILEIAMYDYGNTGIRDANFVRKQLDFTSDLDMVSQKLFGLRTNGGDEYCGAVIKDAVLDLNWSKDSKDLKMIYIAGNEPFNQGPVAFKEACSIAKNKDVIVNTIYCGDRMKGVREFWKEGATCSMGDYFNINSDREVVFIPTPYDDEINQFSQKMNSTYVSYNHFGSDRMDNQIEQDQNALKMGVSNGSLRAKAKISANYSNSSWDLIDAYLADSKVVSKMKKEDLPKELRGKTTKELQEIVDQKLTERNEIKLKISELSLKREAFIKKKKEETNVDETDDFGSAINQSILNKAIDLGFDKPMQ